MKAIARYDPFDEIRKLQKEFDDIFSLFERPVPREWGTAVPAVDVVDEGDSIKVIADLPGVDKKDIHVKVDNNVLEISAERKTATEDKKKDYYYCERSYTSFKRVFRLPEEINPEDAEAEYKDGVLEIRLKKKKQDTKKEIDVK